MHGTGLEAYLYPLFEEWRAYLIFELTVNEKCDGAEIIIKASDKPGKGSVNIGSG